MLNSALKPVRDWIVRSYDLNQLTGQIKPKIVEIYLEYLSDLQKAIREISDRSKLPSKVEICTTLQKINSKWLKTLKPLEYFDTSLLITDCIQKFNDSLKSETQMKPTNQVIEKREAPEKTLEQGEEILNQINELETRISVLQGFKKGLSAQVALDRMTKRLEKLYDTLSMLTEPENH